MKRNLVVVMGIVLITLTIIGTTAIASQQNSEKQFNLKITYDNKYVLDEMLDKDSDITILYGDQVLHYMNLTKNEKVDLETIKIPNNKFISYWQVEQTEEQYIIKPVIKEKKDNNITFMTTNGGIINEQTGLPTLTKTVKDGTKLSEILPEVQTKDNFNFSGWYTLEDVEHKEEIQEEEREDIKEKQSDLKEKEKELDDADDEETEEELESEINAIKKEIADMKKEKKYNTEIITEYQLVDIENTEIKTDQEYIAISYPDQNNNNKDDRKEKIKLTIDYGIEDETIEEEIHVGQPIKLNNPRHEDYIFIGWYLDSKYTENYTSETIFKKDTTIYAKWEKPQDIIANSGEQLIKKERVSNEIEAYLNKRNKSIYDKQKQQSEKQQQERKKQTEKETFNHTEISYKLKTFRENQTHLIKFYEDENFLFSLALPYGRTIEILNSNEQKLKEYGVRQESTINLSDIIDGGDTLNFDVKTKKRNNGIVTQIYPIKDKEME